MIKFGTDGWRSKMNDSFNVENVEKVAQAIADYLNESGFAEKGIFIGYDTRNNSDIFAQACAKVLIANNIKVFFPKRATPTPITAYTIKDMGLGGAVMITASHNPPLYNGIKFIPHYAGPATTEITAIIEKYLKEDIDPSPQEAQDDKQSTTVQDDNQSITAQGNNTNDVILREPPWLEATEESKKFFTYHNPFANYKKHIKKLLDIELLKKSNLKVLANVMFGAGYGIFAKILREADIEVEELNSKPDSNFGGITPEPIPKNLLSTVARLKKGDFDIGLALDGDADRFGVFDKDASFIQANHALALIAEYLVTVKKLKGALVRSVATTHFLDVIAVKNGLKSIETPVGFKYIGQIMRERPVVLGAEESAGLSILGHIPEKDGIIADILLAEIVAYYKLPLQNILENLFNKYERRFLSKRLDLDLEQNKKENLMNLLRQNPPKKIITIDVEKTIDIDGMKFVLADGSWLLARPSGTEPIIRIYIETESQDKLKALEKFAKELVA